MIDFERLEREKDELRNKFLNAKPFPHIGIDEFLLKGEAEKLYEVIPNPSDEDKSRDYIFAKNKFEFSSMMNFSDDFKKLYEELTSDKFAKLISYITNEDIFVDPKFHGGGLHMGGENSYLNMHADFNYHPVNQNWFRNLNMLLYLNKDWKPEYGGNLKLKDKRTKESTEVEVPMNRLAIMHCRGYTLHGYDPINFPKDTYRTSIAIYGYTLHDKQIESQRSTYWVDEKNPLKNLAARVILPMVNLKNKLVGSSTGKHFKERNEKH